MANIDKLNFSFTDGQTTITANHLNSFVDRINKLIDAVGGDTPTPTQTVATPTISISGTTATIACSTSGATIYYTLNGNTPTTSSTQYTGAITLSGACTIKAIAVKSGMTDSEVALRKYAPTAVTYPIQGTGSAIKMPLSDIGSRPQSGGVAGDIIYFEATTQNFSIYRGNGSTYNGKCTIVWDDATHGHVDWSEFASTHIGILDPSLAVGETITFTSNGHESNS